ncbi:unnamed protein product [Rotaria sp. Silwood2]|nr:unnamed protein product [Rotaria sp. Silwood2]CAF4026683.1 unnamed protein product [Rotaria sp. Silwood2]
MQVILACFQLIKAQRQNQVIDTRLIGRIFLQETKEFYRHEPANFLAHNAITEYLKKVVQRLDEEVHRIQSYLHLSTLKPLVKIVEEVLIRDQLEAIYTEAKALLINEKYSNLVLLFQLISRIPNATVDLENIVENHMLQMGNDAISRDLKLYVETIVNIHTKFVKLVQEDFNSEKAFVAIVDKLSQKFINNNAITETAGSTKKSAELLARYCDEVCDIEYTSKLQRMLQDIGVSKNLTDRYRRYYENNRIDNIVDLSVMILSTNSWPFSALGDFVLSLELETIFDSFTKFYNQQQNGRKLTWLYYHSNGDL